MFRNKKKNYVKKENVKNTKKNICKQNINF